MLDLLADVIKPQVANKKNKENCCIDWLMGLK